MMIERPMDVMNQFPVRKSRKQKESFRTVASQFFSSCGYDVSIEKGKFGVHNMVIGNPDTADFLITAHYDTPAELLFPNLITPCNLLPFLGYQVLIIAVILIIALIPGFVLTLLGISTEITSRIWLLCLYISFVLMLIGPANKHNANDNTSGVVTVFEIARSMPVSARDKVCFVLFDLEEAGLLGSSSYRKKHLHQTAHQLVLNLDCVGDGNEIVMFPTKKMKTNACYMNILRRITGTWGQKQIGLRENGFAHYPSDQKHFSYGVGIAAFRRSSWAGLYLGRIHTKKDTILEETNVNILRAAIISMITCSAVK